MNFLIKSDETDSRVGCPIYNRLSKPFADLTRDASDRRLNANAIAREERNLWMTSGQAMLVSCATESQK